jgi:hypothetical protein
MYAGISPGMSYLVKKTTFSDTHFKVMTSVTSDYRWNREIIVKILKGIEIHTGRSTLNRLSYEVAEGFRSGGLRKD